jgi:hypothetical protein
MRFSIKYTIKTMLLWKISLFHKAQVYGVKKKLYKVFSIKRFHKMTFMEILWGSGSAV